MESDEQPAEDLANFDPWVAEGGGQHGFIGKAIAHYDLIFDDEVQLKRWYSFIRGLKVAHPEIRTIGGRVNQFLLNRESGFAEQAPPPKESIKKKKKREVAVTSGLLAPTDELGTEG